jgi:hypothetical protein
MIAAGIPRAAVSHVGSISVQGARELATDRAITIVLHLPEASAQTKPAREPGVQEYFVHRADAVQRT